MRRLALVLVALSAPALAEQKCDANDVWMCCAFFCMANPAGPTAEPTCEQPIKKLHEFWSNHSGFPSCSGFTPQQTPFDPCPAGTTQATGLGNVMLAGPVHAPLGNYAPAAPDRLYVDASVDDPSRINLDGTATSMDLRVCVAGSRGAMTDMDGRYMTLWDRVYLQPPQTDKPYLVQVMQADGSVWSYRVSMP